MSRKHCGTKVSHLGFWCHEEGGKWVFCHCRLLPWALWTTQQDPSVLLPCCGCRKKVMCVCVCMWVCSLWLWSQRTALDLPAWSHTLVSCSICVVRVEFWSRETSSTCLNPWALTPAPSCLFKTNVNMTKEEERYKGERAHFNTTWDSRSKEDSPFWPAS